MKSAKFPLCVAGCVLMAATTAWGQAKIPAWPYAMTYDSVKAAPQNHKLLYEDGKLRFIEVTIKPGEKEPMNGDPYPSVYLHDAPMPDPAQIVDTRLDPNSPLNGQGAGHGVAPPGEEFPTCDTLAPLAPHQVENHGTIPIHFYVLQFKRLDGADLGANWKTWYPWMVGPIPVVKNVDPTNLGPPFSKEWPYPIALDSVAAAPNNHKALYADGRVRVVEVTERPESQENLHGHPYRSVFINDTAPAAPPPSGAAAAPPPRPSGSRSSGQDTSGHSRALSQGRGWGLSTGSQCHPLGPRHGCSTTSRHAGADVLVGHGPSAARPHQRRRGSWPFLPRGVPADGLAIGPWEGSLGDGGRGKKLTQSTSLPRRLKTGLNSRATRPAEPTVNATLRNKAAGISSCMCPPTSPAIRFPKAIEMNHTPII